MDGCCSEGFPCSSESKESTCNVGDRVQYLDLNDPLEKGMATTPVCLPGKAYGQRSLEDHSSWGHKESTQLNKGERRDILGVRN